VGFLNLRLFSFLKESFAGTKLKEKPSMLVMVRILPHMHSRLFTGVCM
jgi:hypothetical protein